MPFSRPHDDFVIESDKPYDLELLSTIATSQGYAVPAPVPAPVQFFPWQVSQFQYVPYPQEQLMAPLPVAHPFWVNTLSTPAYSAPASTSMPHVPEPCKVVEKRKLDDVIVRQRQQGKPRKSSVPESYNPDAENVELLMKNGWSELASKNILGTYYNYRDEKYIVSQFTSKTMLEALTQWSDITKKLDIKLDNNSLFLWGKVGGFDYRGKIHISIASEKYLQKVAFLMQQGVSVKCMDLWFTSSNPSALLVLLEQACSHPNIFEKLDTVDVMNIFSQRIDQLKKAMTKFDDNDSVLLEHKSVDLSEGKEAHDYQDILILVSGEEVRDD